MISRVRTAKEAALFGSDTATGYRAEMPRYARVVLPNLWRATAPGNESVPFSLTAAVPSWQRPLVSRVPRLQSADMASERIEALSQ